MAGRFTRRIYDNCNFQEDLKRRTDPLELVMDVTKFVHHKNICRPSHTYPPTSAQLVDVESSLWGIDKTASNCYQDQYVF